MANWSDLKNSVASIIKTNGNKEITGQLLQDVLNNIISNVGLNSSYAGIATSSTNPGTPDGNVFYLASSEGVYSNFNGISMSMDEIAVLEWNGSWTKKTIQTGSIWMQALGLELPFTKSYTTTVTLFAFRLNRIEGKVRLIGTCSSSWNILYQLRYEDGSYNNHYFRSVNSGSFDLVLDINSISKDIDFASNSKRIIAIDITANSQNVETTGSITVNKILATNNVVDSISIGALKTTLDSYLTRKEKKELPLSLYRNDLPIQIETSDVIQELFNIQLNNRSETIRLIGSSTYTWSFFIQVRNDQGHNSALVKAVSPGDFDFEFDVAYAVKENFTENELKNIRQINIAANSVSSSSIESFTLNEVYGNIDAITAAGSAKAMHEIQNNKSLYGKRKIYGSLLRYGTILDGKGNIIEIAGYRTSAWFEIPREEYDVMIGDGLQDIDLLGSFSGLCIYNENKQFIAALPLRTIIRLEDYPTAKYFIMAASESAITLGLPKLVFYTDNFADERLKNNEEAISNMFKLENSVSLGYEHGTGYKNWFGLGNNPRTTILTQQNMDSPFDGIVETITVDSLTKGKLGIIVGMLDQNNICVPSKEFDVEVKAGLNKINVLSKGIKIKQGEQLFVYVNKYAEETTGAGGALKYVNATEYPNTYSDTENEFIYGRLGQQLSRLATTYGGRASFAYSVIPECAFATRTEVESLRSQIESQSSIIAKGQYVYDENGNAYTLRIVNGEIVPKSINFKNVLCLGNSLTSHNILTSIGYYGNGWAMAATSKKMDWCSLLERMLKQKDSSAKVTRYNIAAWERNLGSYITEDSIANLMQGYMNADVDLVVFKAGENITDTTYMQQSLTTMINWIKKNYPSCTIVVCTQFWANASKDSIITSVANSTDCKFLNSVGGNHHELLGDYTYGDDGNQYPIINQGVAGHVADYGFYIWANTLGSFLGLNQLSEAYDINVNTSLSYKLNRTIGVSGGLITILLQSEPSSVSVKDKGGNTISYSLHDMSNVSFQSTPSYKPTHAITFEMPSSDVNIAIS